MTPNPSQDFLERHAGIIVSAAFHVAFLVLLQNVMLPEPEIAHEPEPEPIRIELSLQTEAEVAEPLEPVAEAPPEWDENVATTTEEQPAEDSPSMKGDLPDTPVSDEFEIAALAPRPIALPRPVEPLPEALNEPDILIQDDSEEEKESSKDDSPDLLLDERIKDYLRNRERALNEYNRDIGQKGSDTVAQRLSLARAQLEGKRWLETTEGAQEGAIRTFSSSGVDPKIAEEVYARYGIESFTQFVDTSRADPSRNYLNSARVGNRQYVRREGKGLFRVLSIPPSAYSHLARLERAGLVERGHDPARTRILEVEFGIASVGSKYDLVVKKMRVAPMEFQP